MEIDRYDPAIDARRFEGGTPPIPSVFAAVAGLRLLLDAGLEKSWNQTDYLHKMLRQELVHLGASVVTPEEPSSHAGMIAFKLVDENKLVSALDQDRIVVSSRDRNLRISPHFYNTEVDVELLIKSLFEHKALFASDCVS
jgi:selenocysteine lyase/cysteine desulfurase